MPGVGKEMRSSPFYYFCRPDQSLITCPQACKGRYKNELIETKKYCRCELEFSSSRKIKTFQILSLFLLLLRCHDRSTGQGYMRPLVPLMSKQDQYNFLQLLSLSFSKDASP